MKLAMKLAMTQVLVALAAGCLFGAGLAVSGMADPARVRGFLDVAGQWDPTLVFVMGGAFLPMALAWRWQRRLGHPLVAPAFDLPSALKIDRKLLVGSLVFGAGWGIAGLCPGPALADLAVRPVQAGVFVASMLGGMMVQYFLLSPKPVK